MEVVVVGSLNIDTTIRVPRLPRPGETLLGSGHFSDTGGKGANQAVAAARLGAAVAMIGRVGDDTGGVTLRSKLTAEGVDTEGIASVASPGTGLAVITVDEFGENTIVVDPGANATLDGSAVRAHRALLEKAGVVLAQLEVPLEAVIEAAALAGGRFVLNPAPAAALPHDLLDRVDVLVPNATELATLVGDEPPADTDTAAMMAASLRGPRAVVVTLGADGALVVAGGNSIHVPAPRVRAVDPTAAGDAFCGGLAVALVRGDTLADAVRWAVKCGAIAATRWGAQASLPTREEVEALEV